ncbi:hypothetical protein BDU57DRAFT_192295 [Ampelomyces quisqualis]|uniref:Uncharacterized protein n=1 Tax=Ampelomyces quisqualis TaxID=50730 RepID=A0A6A5QUJ8_AMPQU|nr:hypothetical protein BDU57DRAFT_192295 [Ampelomyces quisqualis]
MGEDISSPPCHCFLFYPRFTISLHNTISASHLESAPACHTLVSLIKRVLIFFSFKKPQTSSQSMHSIITALSDFTRPLNTSLEDSIRMPQSHSSQKRRKAAARRAPNLEESVKQASARHNAPTPMWDDASRVMFDVPGDRKSKNEDVVQGGQKTGLNIAPRRGAARRPPPIDSGVLNPAHPNSHGEKGGPDATAGLRAPRNPAHSKIHEDREAVVKRDATVQPASISPIDVLKRPGLGATSSSLTLEHVRRLRGQGQQDAALPTLPAFMPNLPLSGSDWAKPSYEIAEPPACVVPEVSEPIGSPQGRPSKGLETLTKAVEGITIFQNTSSSPPDLRSSKQKSASESHEEVEGSESRKVQPIKTREAVKVEADKSTDSFVSLSREFERVGTPAQDESEHNGAKRKWYKGFRR